MTTEQPSEKSIKTEKKLFIVLSLLCLAGLVLLYRAHPSTYSLPRCPFYSLTGCYCPGCGSLRATHYLLQGNWTASLRYHPLLIPLFCFLSFLYVKRVYEFFLGRNIVHRWELRLCIVVVAVWMAFFLLRNVPLDTLDWTRPPEPTQVVGK